MIIISKIEKLQAKERRILKKNLGPIKNDEYRKRHNIDSVILGEDKEEHSYREDYILWARRDKPIGSFCTLLNKKTKAIRFIELEETNLKEDIPRHAFQTPPTNCVDRSTSKKNQN